MINIIKFTVILVLVYRIYLWFPVKWPKMTLVSKRLSVYYGAPGSGKTTWACYWARRAINSGYPVYSNVPIKGTYKLDKSDLGRWNIEHALVLWDEAGIDWNNRDFATNFRRKPDDGVGSLEWFKKHRHEHCEVMVFSQGFDDMDKKIRDLNTDMYICRKSLIPYLLVRKRVKKSPDIDREHKTPIDAYSYALLGSQRIAMPPLWKYFNSFDRLGLPEKPHWTLWDDLLPSMEESAGQSPAVAEPQLEELTLEELEEMINKPVGTKFLDTPITAPGETQDTETSTENL